METSQQPGGIDRLAALSARIEAKGYNPYYVDSYIKGSGGIITTDADIFDYATSHSATALDLPVARITLADQADLQKTVRGIYEQIMGKPPPESEYLSDIMEEALEEHPFLFAVTIDPKLDPAKLSSAVREIADMVRNYTSHHGCKAAVLAEKPETVPSEVARNLRFYG